MDQDNDDASFVMDRSSARRLLHQLRAWRDEGTTARETVSGLSHLLSVYVGDAEDDDDDDEDYSPSLSRSNSRPPRSWQQPATEPQPAGTQLLKSGEFGRISSKLKDCHFTSNLGLVNQRSTHPKARTYKEDYISKLVPNSKGTIVALYDSNIYTGQFSRDSSFYYTCSQDFRLQIYDTTKPTLPRPVGTGYGASVKTTLNLSRTIQVSHGRWTITDANLSPDNQRIVYCSLTPAAYVSSTVEDNPRQIPLNFSDPQRRRGWQEWDDVCLYSCQFSADGNDVVAGGRGMIYVYDLLADRRAVKIKAHSDDVNSVCWADTASGNVLVSASDDTFLKVWDRRSLGASPRPSGVLIGHTEGITYVAPKGDGRYVISNGKDQALRLWDLRKMRSQEDFISVKDDFYGVPDFDYRYPYYPKPKHSAHPLDCSVMTYRGHAVLRTLIRCHFSPAETTGSEYIYSGSYDGKIHIWSLDGTVVQVLDRAETFPISYDPSGPEFPLRRSGERSPLVVRDVSWNSQRPALFTAAWDSGQSGGSSVACHEWKGLSKIGKLEDWVEKAREEHLETRRRSVRLRDRRQRGMPGALLPVEDEDDDFW